VALAPRSDRPGALPSDERGSRDAIHVVIRRTTDWGDEETFRAQLTPSFAPSVELWNATFDLPYRLFRRELKRIAELSLARAGVVLVALASGANLPFGAIVVPADDDDWFAPDFAPRLAAAVSGRHAGYSWPSRFLEVPISVAHRLGRWRRALFPSTRPKWVCTTNNHAIVLDAETAPLVASHVAASRWFEAHPGRVRRLDEPLSVMNRSLASQTSFWSVSSRAALLRKFRRYRALYRAPVAGDLAWCAPYVALMRDLMDGMRVRS